MSRRIEKVMFILVAIVCIWICASFVDVIIHNMDKEPIYQSWNFFTNFVKIFG